MPAHTLGATGAAGRSTLVKRTHDPLTYDGPGGLFSWGRGNRGGTLAIELFWNGAQHALARAGVPVASSDFASPTHWGNDAALATIPDSLTDLDRLGCNGQVFIIAVSMGVPLVLSWARLNLAKVAGIALLTPAVALEAIRSTNRNGYAAELEAAYGGAAAWQTARPTHDPASYAADFTGVKMGVWRSTNDPVCLPAEVDAFAAAAGADVFSLGAVGHSAGSLDPQDVADFLLAA